MKVVLDTSIIVEIDRKNSRAIKTIKNLIGNNHDILVSSVTISEILAGSYLRKDFERAVQEAKRLLGQFLWIDFDARIAEKTAQYIAYLITEGKIIEYQDIAIAATFKAEDADYLLTQNKTHFESLPDLKGKVCSLAEFEKII